MGNYASQTELQNHVGTVDLARLTADSGSTPNATIVAQEIDLAEGEVDGYLSTRYTTPINLAATPDLTDWLKQLTLKIAAWRCWHRRNVKIPSVELDYKDAIEQLKSFVAGEAEGPGADIPEAIAKDQWGFSEAKATPDTMEGL